MEQHLIRELQSLPEKIKDANQRYLTAWSACEMAKFDLLSTRYEFFRSGKVAGSNEDMRNANLWTRTEELEHKVRQLKQESELLKMEVDYLKQRFEGAKYTVVLLKSGV